MKLAVNKTFRDDCVAIIQMRPKDISEQDLNALYTVVEGFDANDQGTVAILPSVIDRAQSVLGRDMFIV